MIFDFNTNNESFIILVKKLKDLGIKKCYFPLKLYDETLVGVDPFNEEKLTLEQKSRILKEIRINIWYYLREIVRMKETGGITRYKAHRGNIAQTFCFINNIDVIEELPRQNGKTMGAVSNYSWLNHFASINSSCIFSNKQLADSQKNIERFAQVTELLPSYLKTHMNERVDTNNLDKIRYDLLNNEITALSTPRDDASADKLGRGCTVANLWFDEFAYLSRNKKVFDASAFAFSNASEAAERNGNPYSRIITTTPNKLDIPEGAFCYSIIDKAIPFDEGWYDLDIETVKRDIDSNSKNGFVYIKFSYLELGHDEAWLEKQKKLVNYDMLTIKREIFLEWTMSGDGAVFSEEQLTVLKEQVIEPIGKFYIDNIYKFNIYEELKNVRTRSYIISVDIAGGLEEDSTVITIIDPFTYHPVASFKSSKIDTVALTDLLVTLVNEFFNGAVVVPERNNMGISVIHMLLKTDIADHIYYETKGGDNDSERTVNNLKSANSTSRKNKKLSSKKAIRVYGIDTTTASRKIMIEEILNMIVNEHPEYCNNTYFFNEIKTLVRNKKGKVEARSGLHDDCVLSYLIGLYMILYGKNCNKFLKVTYVGNDVEEEVNTNIHKKAKQSVKKIYNILSNPNQDFMTTALDKNSAQKMHMDEINGIIPTNVSKNHKTVRSINKILNMTRY